MRRRLRRRWPRLRSGRCRSMWRALCQRPRRSHRPLHLRFRARPPSPLRIRPQRERHLRLRPSWPAAARCASGSRWAKPFPARRRFFSVRSAASEHQAPSCFHHDQRFRQRLWRAAEARAGARARNSGCSACAGTGERRCSAGTSTSTTADPALRRGGAQRRHGTAEECPAATRRHGGAATLRGRDRPADRRVQLRPVSGHALDGRTPGGADARTVPAVRRAAVLGGQRSAQPAGIDRHIHAGERTTPDLGCARGLPHLLRAGRPEERQARQQGPGVLEAPRGPRPSATTRK